MPAARFARKASPAAQGPRITATLAADILGINRTRDNDLRPMARALSLHAWNNTAEEDLRRTAANWALRNWSAYQAECSRRRDARTVDPVARASRLLILMVDAHLEAAPSEPLQAEAAALQEALDGGADLAGPAAALLDGIESRGEAARHGGIAWTAGILRGLVPPAPAPGR